MGRTVLVLVIMLIIFAASSPAHADTNLTNWSDLSKQVVEGTKDPLEAALELERQIHGPLDDKGKTTLIQIVNSIVTTAGKAQIAVSNDAVDMHSVPRGPAIMWAKSNYTTATLQKLLAVLKITSNVLKVAGVENDSEVIAQFYLFNMIPIYGKGKK